MNGFLEHLFFLACPEKKKLDRVVPRWLLENNGGHSAALLLLLLRRRPPSLFATNVEFL